MSPILGVVASGWDNTPAGAFESIATATASSGTKTLTFSSIPSTYTSLQIRGLASNTTADSLLMKLNSDGGSNYTLHRVRGSGSAVSAQGFINQVAAYVDSENGIVSGTYPDTKIAYIIDIHDYASTSNYKTVRTFAGWDRNGAGYVGMVSNLWRSTSAISTISFSIDYASSEFSVGSTFALYGIKGA